MAAATTAVEPVPPDPFHLLRSPDSNPSAKTVSVYSERAGRGESADEAAESGPVPTALIAATVKVYEVPFASPVTV